MLLRRHLSGASPPVIIGGVDNYNFENLQRAFNEGHDAEFDEDDQHHRAPLDEEEEDHDANQVVIPLINCPFMGDELSRFRQRIVPLSLDDPLTELWTRLQDALDFMREIIDDRP
jgi:hypothetical protein